MRAMVKACGVCLVALAMACSSARNPTVVSADAGQELGPQDSGPEVCTPECEGRECGPDHCGGSCGECSSPSSCTDAGQCEPVECQSSKDCPLNLVCDKEGGHCVACVGDEDCAAGQVCGADHKCHEVFACESDKDCKEQAMVCDKEAGICVQCVSNADCAADAWCGQSYCLPDVCTGGALACDGKDVLSCAEDGSGWTVKETCDLDEYCDDEACHEYKCAPGFAWCEADVALRCSEDGKSVASESDCSKVGQFCHEGECIDTVCVPEEQFCVDATTKGACAADGMSVTPIACEVEQFCQAGLCHPWLCVPGEAFCEGPEARLCNDTGSAIASQQDCSLEGQVCVDGKCEDHVCVPDSSFCHTANSLAVCSWDGMSFEIEPCPGGAFCEEVTCVPWLCEPGSSYCQGETAHLCNVWGSGPEGAGTDCTGLGGCCLVGQCQVAVEEVCDGQDNDCDGFVDEGVLSPCGDCDPACQMVAAGPGDDQPMDPGGGASFAMSTTEEGYLKPMAQKPPLTNLWVANSGESTVSRVDMTTGNEVGRYKGCNDPSRTAVDLHGNVWVGCRADGGVMKIAADHSFCKDKDDNGMIDTSGDLNGDGKIDASEMHQDDECLVLQVYPGGSCQRAVGVDRDNHVWVGQWNAKTLKRLHPDTGQVVQSVSIPANPYGLVVDNDNIVWISGRGGDSLVRVNPGTGEVKSWKPSGGNLYGITLDVQGRVWLGQFTNGTVARFDPQTLQFLTVSTGSCPRGMMGSLGGYVFAGMGCGDDKKVTRIDVDTLEVKYFSTIGPGGVGGQQPIGVSLDSEGHVWAINYASSDVSKLSQETGEVVGVYPVGYHPYTYSDMTGYVLHSFTAPDTKPFYQAEFDAGQTADWQSVTVEMQVAGAGCPGMTIWAFTADESEEDGAFIALAQDVAVATAVIEAEPLLSSGRFLTVKVVLPFQSDSCEVTLQGVAATYHVQ